MRISDIDKDFENIIYYLDENGFKPYSSCDGVEANHKNSKDVNYGYISFLKSPKIINLMAAFLNDKDNFIVSLGSESHIKLHELYGNVISGNTYSVFCKNRVSENTNYLENIIKDVVEGKENISDENKRKLDILDKSLEENSDCDLCFEVSFNSNYATYMKKDEKINVLEIFTKEGEEKRDGNIIIHTERDMNVLADILSKKYAMTKKKYDSKEEYPDSEFIETEFDRSSCYIYFTDEHFSQILEQIQYIKQIAHTLPIFEGREWIGSDEEFLDNEYDENMWDIEDNLYTDYFDDDEQLKTQLEQREEELSRLESEQQKIRKLEQMINDYSSKDDNSIGK